MSSSALRVETPAPLPALAPARVPPWPKRLRVPLVLLLAVLGGAAYGIHVRETEAGLLGWISTVPWLLIAVHPRLAGRGNAWVYLGMLHLMTAVGLYWLRGQGTATWLVAPLMYYPLALPSYFIPLFVRRRWPGFPLAVLWPVVFTGVEWLRVRLCPGELSLCTLGYSQVSLTKLIQVADIGGVGAVTFVVAAVAGLLAEVVTSATTPPRLRARARSLALQAAGVAVLLGAVIAYGFHQDTEEHFSPGPTFHVLQAHVAHPRDEELARRMYDVQVVMTKSTKKPGQVDAVLWPENAIMAPLYERGTGFHPYYGPDLLALTREVAAPILVDGPSHDPQTRRDYHSAIFVKPDGSYEVYDKVRLLPWTEYVPLRGFFRLFGGAAEKAWEGFVQQFVGFVPAGSPGDIDRLAPFHLTTRDGRSLAFGTPLCFEIATARVVNRWHRQGIDFLVNQTSEGLLGDSVHEQTITVCGFRAVEGRTCVVRATNDGISALIDPNGRVREVLRGRATGSPINEGGVFYPTIVLDSRRGTFYTRHGDWLAISCLVVALGLAAASLVRRGGV